MSDDLPILNPAEARILGCLIEKKELTPDIYPLTLNAAHAAANQKTAREPVMALELVEIRRAFGQLEQKGLVRQAFASRVERYEHTVAQRFSLTSSQIAMIGLLLLRGPQTAYELLARSRAHGAVLVDRGASRRSRPVDRPQAAARRSCSSAAPASARSAMRICFGGRADAGAQRPLRSGLRQPRTWKRGSRLSKKNSRSCARASTP